MDRHAAGGHFATVWTHIDDLVESVRAITPSGTWESCRLPGSGAGPSPDRMLIGLEGILGVISEAWVRVHDRPRHKLSAGVAFDSFTAGVGAVRALGQSGLNPANCRLLDEAESELTHASEDGRATLVLGFESAHQPVDALMDQVERRATLTAAILGRSGARSCRRAGAPPAPGATRSSRRPTCATRSSP